VPWGSIVTSVSRIERAAGHSAAGGAEPPNKRMQPTALHFQGTLDSAPAAESPQLMRGPLGSNTGT
jgi:hypothetical protein